MWANPIIFDDMEENSLTCLSYKALKDSEQFSTSTFLHSSSSVYNLFFSAFGFTDATVNHFYIEINLFLI